MLKSIHVCAAHTKALNQFTFVTNKNRSHGGLHSRTHVTRSKIETEGTY